VSVDVDALKAVRLKLQQLEREISDLHATTAHDSPGAARISHHCANLRHSASKLRILLNDAVGADAWSKSYP
jgi:hypothetical protein